MSTFLFDEIIFGPVKSRRLGVSLGVNLLPTNDKICSFNCLYCECGWTNSMDISKLCSREDVRKALEHKLLQMQNDGEAPDVITFAGNGEPTLHPQFADIIDDTIELRNRFFPKAQVAVLSNATMIFKNDVRNALNRVDQNILKLDSAIENTIKILNQPLMKFSLQQTVDNLLKFNGNLIIQTLFVRGQSENQTIDNTTEKEITAWIRLLKKIKPYEVMVYTIARETPNESLKKIELSELQQIAKRVEEFGIKVQVAG